MRFMVMVFGGPIMIAAPNLRSPVVHAGFTPRVHDNILLARRCLMRAMMDRAGIEPAQTPHRTGQLT